MVFFYLVFIGILLIFPKETVPCAYEGLVQWATRMVPTLFPFMMMSSLMIYTGADSYLTRLLSPVLKPLFSCSANGFYVVFMGFLCGFPMGAKSACDLLLQKKITKNEAQYLLSFCNNVSPAYLFGIVLPMIQSCGYTKKLPVLFGSCGIPFLYGILLGKLRRKSEEVSVRVPSPEKALPVRTSFRHACLDSLQSILLLGGYVTFVNAFCCIPRLLGLSPSAASVAGGFLEIIRGIWGIYENPLLPSMWRAFLILVSISFGGICCLLQTMSITAETGLSIRSYLYHKVVIAVISAGYYYLIFFVLP